MLAYQDVYLNNFTGSTSDGYCKLSVRQGATKPIIFTRVKNGATGIGGGITLAWISVTKAGRPSLRQALLRMEL